MERRCGVVNCLTVDFDIILRPFINLYNDVISDNMTFGEFDKEYPTLSGLIQPDYFIYEYITTFLMKLFKRLPKEKVFFIKSHEGVVKVLEQFDPGHELCNLDHHHDIGYENVNINTKITQYNVDCGNWVKYLKDQKIINNYVWIHNPNSNFPDPELEKKYIAKEYELRQVDLETQLSTVDMVILCKSPEWLPVSIEPLWKLWMELANSTYNVEFNLS